MLTRTHFILNIEFYDNRDAVTVTNQQKMYKVYLSPLCELGVRCWG
jgi:hypothetical protein